MNLEFKECSICAAKPGHPPLCPSCLHNRSTIEKLRAKLDAVYLGPCPFCQYDMEEMEWVEGEWVSEDRTEWHTTYGVGCPRCECHGPMHKTQELAIKGWNV